MNRQTLLAFVFSILVLIIWTFLMKEKYQPVNVNDKTPPIFQGLKEVSFDKSSGTIKLTWDKAKDKSQVTYLIYYSENSEITNFDKPAYYTTNTYYEISDLNPEQTYYFMVKAVDTANNFDVNNKLKVFKAIESKISKEELIKITTSVADYTLSSMGGRIKSVVMRKYKNVTDKSNVKLVLYPEKRYKQFYAADFEIIDVKNNNFIKNDFKQYSFSMQGTNIIFRAKYNSDINIKKEYIFHDKKYSIDYRVTLEYTGSRRTLEKYNEKEVVLKWQPFIGPVDEKNQYNILTTAYFADGKLNNIKYTGGGFLTKKYNYYKKIMIKQGENIEYISFLNRYFVAAIVPMEKYRVKKTLFYSDGKIYIAGISSQITKNFIDNGRITYNYIIYAGPKLRDTFRADKNLNSLEKSIQFRKWISPVGNLFLDMLRFMYKLIPNWGIAIIFFTLLIKLVLYPLTHKQFESMARMQKIQPVIMQLKNQYKNNPQKMNQELMKVYKKYKVNPFGGCLPLILQIPIFLAIWDMLQYSFELRSASFLWIKSLSLPDTIGHIAGIPFNPLPLIMGATMLIQQKLSTTDPQHKMTMMLMPIIFLFFFWNMPSGLVLYWTLQNIFSIGQQMYLNKKLNVGGQNESN